MDDDDDDRLSLVSGCSGHSVGSVGYGTLHIAEDLQNDVENVDDCPELAGHEEKSEMPTKKCVDFSATIAVAVHEEGKKTKK